MVLLAALRAANNDDNPPIHTHIKQGLQLVVLCCCQFLTAILFYCNAAILFGTLQASFLICKEPTNTQSIAIKKTVIPTTTTIPLLQYKN
jgi:hypothetical protein